MTLAGVCLVAGCYRGFRSIWVVTVLSVTAILVAEPVLSWLVFREPPATGAVIGMALAALGCICAILL